MIYVYGIAPSGVTVESPPDGLAGSEVRASAVDGLTAYVSEVGDQLEADEAALWTHERVVEAIMSTTTVIPARFGTLFPDESSLHQAMLDRRPALQAALEKVAGMAELGVRVIAISDDASEGEPEDGRDYLMRKVQAGRKAKELASAVEGFHRKLAPTSTDHRARWFVTDRLVLSAAYLVPVDEVQHFKELAENGPHPEGVEVMCTGPWPPYNFVDATESE